MNTFTSTVLAGSLEKSCLPGYFFMMACQMLLVLIATNFSSGSQNSPFAILKGEEGQAIVLKSIHLLPEISVTDADFTAGLTAEQVRTCGLKSLSHAVRAYLDPDCTELTVFFPIIRFGISILTCGSSAVFLEKASDVVPTPAAIITPPKLLFLSMTPSTVAVPRSHIMHGHGNLSAAATASATVSAPSCAGLSMPLAIIGF